MVTILFDVDQQTTTQVAFLCTNAVQIGLPGIKQPIARTLELICWQRNVYDTNSAAISHSNLHITRTVDSATAAAATRRLSATIDAMEAKDKLDK